MRGLNGPSGVDHAPNFPSNFNKIVLGNAKTPLGFYTIILLNRAAGRRRPSQAIMGEIPYPALCVGLKKTPRRVGAP